MIRKAPTLISRVLRCSLSTGGSIGGRIRPKDGRPCVNCPRRQPFSSGGGATRSSKESKNSSPKIESMEKSWDRMRRRLLDRTLYPPGSYTCLQWNEAQQAVKALKPLLNSNDPDAIKEAFALLDRLCLEVKAAEGDVKAIVLPLPIVTLGLAVDAWRRCDQITASLSTSEVISKVEDYMAKVLFSRDVKVFNILIDAVGRKEAPSEAPIMAESLLENMVQRSEPEDETHPNVVTVSNIIHLWSKSGLNDAPAVVETHLRRLQEWYQQTGREDQKPDSYTYSSVITTWARSGHRDAPHRAEELLQEMKAAPGEEVNAVVYNSVIDALAKSGREGTAGKAHSLLNEMLRLHSEGNSEVKPDATTFASVIVAYGRMGKAEVAEGILDELETRYDRTGDPDFRPNKICYNAVIDAFANRGEPHRAEAVLQRMFQQSESGNDLARPDIVGLTTVLKAWANSRNPEAADHATKIVESLKAFSKSGNKLLQPEIRTFTSLLDCYAKSPRPEMYATAAEKLLVWTEEQSDNSLKPNDIIYQACLMVLQRAGLPERAQALLKKMYARYRSGITSVRPNTRHFTTVISAWARSNDPRAAENAEQLMKLMEDLHAKEGLDSRPNNVTFNTLIHCLSRSKDSDAPDRAERVLRLMQKQFEEGDKRVKPNAVTYSSVISAWSRSPKKEACLRAESLLREMIDHGVVPTVKTYNAVMVAFERHGHPHKVEEIFREMEMYVTGSKRNFPAYITLLQAWARAGEPERTASVLKEILREYEAGNLNEQPTTQTFNTVLQAWYRSGREDAAEQAEKGLNMMHELAASGRFNCHPTAFTYGCVISAYARSNNADAAERVYDLLQRLQGHYSEQGDVLCRPNLVIYTEVISTLARTADSRWSKVIESLIQDMDRVESKNWQDPKQISGFRKVIASLLKSSLHEKEHFVQQILDLMKQHGVKPNRATQHEIERERKALEL